MLPPSPESLSLYRQQLRSSSIQREGPSAPQRNTWANEVDELNRWPRRRSGCASAEPYPASERGHCIKDAEVKARSKRVPKAEILFCSDNYSAFAPTIMSTFAPPPTHLCWPHSIRQYPPSPSRRHQPRLINAWVRPRLSISSCCCWASRLWQPVLTHLLAKKHCGLRNVFDACFRIRTVFNRNPAGEAGALQDGKNAIVII